MYYMHVCELTGCFGIARVCASILQRILMHSTLNAQGIKEILRKCKSTEINVNVEDENGDMFLHVLVRRIVSSNLKSKEHKAALDSLWKFLVYCDTDSFDINVISKHDGNTALHIALLVSLFKCSNLSGISQISIVNHLLRPRILNA